MLKKLYDINSSITLVRMDLKKIEDFNLEYRLYEIACSGMKKKYAIAVLSEPDESFAVIGDELAFSQRLYVDLMRGNVTPCTLKDVVEDLTKKEYLY